jgi:hypothetical protein
MPKQMDPVSEAIKAARENPTLWRKLRQWLDASSVSTDGLVLQGVLNKWLEDPSSHKVPDMVEYLYDYAYAYVILRDWTDLPIEIPENDYQAWRDRLYEPTFAGTQSRMMGVLGGFLKLSGQRPDMVIPLMEQQVAAKLARLKEALELPLKEYYTPHILTPEEIDDGMEFQMGDERKRLNEPFDLFDQLSYFALGLEDARLHCFDEHPNLGLPNAGLFGALCEIDLPELLAELDKCEAGLKRIQRHLAKYQGANLSTNHDVAPDEAWWRHWKPENNRSRQHHSRPSRKS